MYAAASAVRQRTLQFLNNNWKNNDNGLNEAYLESLENTSFFLHAAAHNITVPATIFYNSFLHLHRICYIHRSDDDVVQLRLNFPLLPDLKIWSSQRVFT